MGHRRSAEQRVAGSGGGRCALIAVADEEASAAAPLRLMVTGESGRDHCDGVYGGPCRVSFTRRPKEHTGVVGAPRWS